MIQLARAQETTIWTFSTYEGWRVQWVVP